MTTEKLTLRIAFDRASLRDFTRRARRLERAMTEHAAAVRDMLAWKPQLRELARPSKQGKKINKAVRK